MRLPRTNKKWLLSTRRDRLRYLISKIITMWGAYNTKYPKMVNYYKNYIWDKCWYSAFFRRVRIKKIPYHIAIKPINMRWKHNIKTKIYEDWRECCNCWIYKKWKEFGRDRHTSTWYRTICITCRDKYKKEYRKNNQDKIKAYRLYRRKPAIWSKIALYKVRYIDWIPREDICVVLDRIKWKWNLIKSEIDWLERWVDFGDNIKSVKFYYL